MLLHRLHGLAKQLSCHSTVDRQCLAIICPGTTQGCHWPSVHQQSYEFSAAAVVVQGVLLHLGYDGWWEEDMQELPLKRMSDAKVISCFSRVYVF